MGEKNYQLSNYKIVSLLLAPRGFFLSIRPVWLNHGYVNNIQFIFWDNSPVYSPSTTLLQDFLLCIEMIGIEIMTLFLIIYPVFGQ